MRRVPKPEPTPQEGLDKYIDGSLMTSKYTPESSRVRMDEGILKRDTGSTNITGYKVPDIVMWIGQYSKPQGSKFTGIITTRKIYMIDSALETIVDGTVGGGEYSGTGTINHRVTATTFADGRFYMSNGIDPIQVWDGDIGSYSYTLVDEDGVTVPYKAKTLSAHYSYLLMGGTYEAGRHEPFRVRWCDTSNTKVWDSGNAGYLDVADTLDWITGIKSLYGTPIVYKENSIYEMNYTGYPNIFSAAPITTSVGCAAINSLVEVPSGPGITRPIHMFMSEFGVHIFDSREQHNIADPYLIDYLFGPSGILNLDQIHTCWGLHVPNRQEYWLGIPQAGTSPDVCVKYSLRTKGWTKRPLQISAAGLYQEYAINRWVSVPEDTTTWANWEGLWIEQAGPSGLPTILMGDVNGNIFEDNGSVQAEAFGNGVCSFETKDYRYANGERLVQFDFEVKGTADGQLGLSYSFNQGAVWSDEEFFTLTTDFRVYKQDMHQTVHEVRWRFRTYAISFEFKSMQPWIIERKRSHYGVAPGPELAGSQAIGNHMLVSTVGEDPLVIYKINLATNVVDDSVSIAGYRGSTYGKPIIINGIHYYLTADAGADSVIAINPYDMSYTVISMLPPGDITAHTYAIFQDDISKTFWASASTDELMASDGTTGYAYTNPDSAVYCGIRSEGSLFLFNTVFTEPKPKIYRFDIATLAFDSSIHICTDLGISTSFQLAVRNPATGTVWLHLNDDKFAEYNIDGTEAVFLRLTAVISLTPSGSTAQLWHVDHFTNYLIYMSTTTIEWFNLATKTLDTTKSLTIGAGYNAVAVSLGQRRLWALHGTTHVMTEVNLDTQAIVGTNTISGIIGTTVYGSKIL